MEPDALDIAVNTNDGVTHGNEPLPEVPGETSSVFTLHPASLYAMYSNFMHGLSNHVKSRVMRFMRHEIDSSRRASTTNVGGPRDVEGGSLPRGSNITYDSLIFKITIILGFLLQFPVMWVAGGIFFLTSNNFKASTVKWGCANVALATLSIIYVVNQWEIGTDEFLYQRNPDETVMVESSRHVQPWEAIILEGEQVITLKMFVHTDKLRWRTFDTGNMLSSDGPLSIGGDGALADPKAVSSDHIYYCIIGDETVIRGWIQIGAIFSNTTVTERSAYPSRHSPPGKLPVVYNPTDSMIFDVGLRCVSGDSSPVFIGVNATELNNKVTHSAAFYMPDWYKCALAYSTTGSKPVVHSAFIKAL